MPNRQRPLSEAFFADDRTDLDNQFWNRFVQEVTARFTRLEKIEIDWERVSQQGIDVALARINEVLLPAAQNIRDIAELGFLIANSATELTLEADKIKTFIVNEAERDLFTPGPFLAVTRVDNADDYAVGRLMFFNRETGVLDVKIDSIWGDPGPHSDWQISATAGAVNAQISMLDQVGVIKSEIETLRGETATDRGLAQDARTGAETAAGGAVTARTGSETARDKAQEWATKAEDEPVETGPDAFSARHYAKKAEAAASAIAQSDAAGISYSDVVSQLGLDLADRNVQKAIEAVVLRGRLIGEPFFLFDNITGVSVPDNSGTAKYIRLTAGQSGAGGYNEGLLTNESVSGSAPLVEATAEIATGPLAGQIVPLINTEEAFIRARETSGALQQDQMQRITGETTNAEILARNSMAATGALSIPSIAASVVQLGTNGNRQSLAFDSADSPNARASSTTSGETRSKNRSATAYMRIV